MRKIVWTNFALENLTKTLVLLVFSLITFTLQGQEIDCHLEQAPDFKEFKSIYDNIIADEYKNNLDDTHSENDIELTLFKKPDRFNGELTSIVIKNDRIFGFKKDTLKVSYINVSREDSELVNHQINQLNNNFYVNFCNTKTTHRTIYVLIVKKKGEVISGYLSLNSLNFQTKNKNKDFSALNNLLSVLYRSSYSK